MVFKIEKSVCNANFAYIIESPTKEKLFTVTPIKKGCYVTNGDGDEIAQVIFSKHKKAQLATITLADGYSVTVSLLAGDITITDNSKILNLIGNLQEYIYNVWDGKENIISVVPYSPNNNFYQINVNNYNMINAILISMAIEKLISSTKSK